VVEVSTCEGMVVEKDVQYVGYVALVVGQGGEGGQKTLKRGCMRDGRVKGKWGRCVVNGRGSSDRLHG
jgi:hypothetical protein